MTRIIAIYSAKGGVGKSTTAFSLSKELSKNHKVTLLDADIYGSSQLSLCQNHLKNQNAENNFKFGNISLVTAESLYKDKAPLIWRAPMVNKLIQYLVQEASKLTSDFIVVDLPPGTGDIQLSITQQLNISTAIVVTNAEKISLDVTQKSVDMLRKTKVNILGIVENFSYFACKHCDEKEFLYEREDINNFSKSNELDILASIAFGKNPTKDDGFNELSNQVINHNFKIYPFNFINKKNDLIITNSKQKVIIGAKELREKCPCAICKKNKLNILNDIYLTSVDKVGNYGIKIFFSDGHKTGIYDIDNLFC